MAKNTSISKFNEGMVISNEDGEFYLIIKVLKERRCTLICGLCETQNIPDEDAFIVTNVFDNSKYFALYSGWSESIDWDYNIDYEYEFTISEIDSLSNFVDKYICKLFNLDIKNVIKLLMDESCANNKNIETNKSDLEDETTHMLSINDTTSEENNNNDIPDTSSLFSHYTERRKAFLNNLLGITSAQIFMVRAGNLFKYNESYIMIIDTVFPLGVICELVDIEELDKNKNKYIIYNTRYNEEYDESKLLICNNEIVKNVDFSSLTCDKFCRFYNDKIDRFFKINIAERIFKENKYIIFPTAGEIDNKICDSQEATYSNEDSILPDLDIVNDVSFSNEKFDDYAVVNTLSKTRTLYSGGVIKRVEQYADGEIPGKSTGNICKYKDDYVLIVKNNNNFNRQVPTVEIIKLELRGSDEKVFVINGLQFTLVVNCIDNTTLTFTANSTIVRNIDINDLAEMCNIDRLDNKLMEEINIKVNNNTLITIFNNDRIYHDILSGTFYHIVGVSSNINDIIVMRTSDKLKTNKELYVWDYTTLLYVNINWFKTIIGTLICDDIMHDSATEAMKNFRKYYNLDIYNSELPKNKEEFDKLVKLHKSELESDKVIDVVENHTEEYIENNLSEEEKEDSSTNTTNHYDVKIIKELSEQIWLTVGSELLNVVNKNKVKIMEYLLEIRDKNTNYILRSIREISQVCELSVQTITELINGLIKLNLISKIKYNLFKINMVDLSKLKAPVNLNFMISNMDIIKRIVQLLKSEKQFTELQKHIIYILYTNYRFRYSQTFIGFLANTPQYKISDIIIGIRQEIETLKDGGVTEEEYLKEATDAILCNNSDITIEVCGDNKDNVDNTINEIKNRVESELGIKPIEVDKVTKEYSSRLFRGSHHS